MKNRFFIALPMAVSLMVPAAWRSRPTTVPGQQDKDNQYCLQVVADRSGSGRTSKRGPAVLEQPTHPGQPARR